MLKNKFIETCYILIEHNRSSEYEVDLQADRVVVREVMFYTKQV